MLKLNRFYTVLFHTAIWSVLILCIWLWRPSQPQPRSLSFVPLSGGLLIWTGLPFIGLFYLHGYVLIPLYLSRKKRLLYFTYTFLALIVVIALSGLMPFIGTQPPNGYYFSMRRIAPGFFFLMASASVGAWRENAKLEKAKKERETELLRLELSFLRAQVNPHFMLNVLNSMALLARRKSDLLEPVLLELARLMNYMLYDAGNGKISLEDEISYLRAYIDLQLLRFGDDVKVFFNTPEVVTQRSIEPMLFIPLVENAFKHGIGLVTDPVITIGIHAGDDNRVCLVVENKYNPLVRQQGARSQGIGLSNLRKRLDLVYPGDYDLQSVDNRSAAVSAKDNRFVTTLNIPLQ
ncbi:sensor histidine kinase [Puia sp.]|uniref:sensor histidine kinase n=1 Tax=Puia sp. TaxID=2045100 RepID=UPI002F427046